MNSNKPTGFEYLRNLCEHVRKRPGMYLGASGPGAGPRLIDLLLNALLADEAPLACEEVSLSITQRSELQAIAILFIGMRSTRFPLGDTARWFSGGFRNGNWEIAAVAGISDRFKLEVWTKQSGTKLVVRCDGGFQISSRPCKAVATPGVRITFQPSAAFQGLKANDLYGISAVLRDVSLLRPGTITRLRADILKSEICYYYKDGLKSLLFEEDYARWALHPECLSFVASLDDMSVEGHLRFLHSGIPYVRNYVNYHPCQGGAHLEGLGDALGALFPDTKRGCREAVLVTNPDTGAKVYVPHTFAGALHLRLADPKYNGPTKDVLIGRTFANLCAKRQANP